MATAAGGGGFADAILIDLKRLHATWMELVFPRQRVEHSVLGKWKPSTTSGTIAYRVWAAIGILVVGFLYPLVLAGLATRFYSRRIDSAVATLGIVGVVVVAAALWGILTVIAHFQFSQEGFLAVAAAATVATVSAGLSAAFVKIGGRGTTVLFAYPAAMNAIFLPPTVAALFSGLMWELVFHRSDEIAIWILDTFLWLGGLNDLLRATFDLEEGFALVAMWAAIAVPLGWFLGVLVTLADVVRPKRRDSQT